MDKAENILREFEELHGQITIDERKWLRDRIAAEFSPPEPTEGHALRRALTKVEELIRRDPSCFNLSEELETVRQNIRSALRAMPLQDHASAPHPRWKSSDESDRHPQTVEDWDCRNDPVAEGLDHSRRRLNVAGDYDDPRAPSQMALVLRQDITRLMNDWIHKNAVFEIWCKEREDARAAAKTVAEEQTEAK